MILACRCGQRLNAPGATPGRVGKCSRCGSLITVAADLPRPEAVPSAGPLPEAAPRPRPARASGIYQPTRASGAVRSGRPALADGLAVVPTRAETTLRGSWSYPFRNASGIALLVIAPPLLWFAALPLATVVPLMLSGSMLAVVMLMWSVPQLLLLGYVLGHVLAFLGEVVVSSCLGDPALPRSASWLPADAFAGWGRWILAGLFGGVAGGFPALAYWVRCGDVDWLDRVVLLDLALPGLAYAQMALVVALLHESAWAVVQPVLIARAIRTAGRAYLGPCLVTGTALVALAGCLAGWLAIRDPFLQALGGWLWWVAALYAAMVVLRHLGLCCYRRDVLGGGVARRR